MIRKFEVPHGLEFKEPFTVSALLDLHRTYIIGPVSISRTGNAKDFPWMVCLNGVSWNCQIKGSDTVEGYETIEEAVFVASRLHSFLGWHDSESAILLLMDELNEFSTARNE